MPVAMQTHSKQNPQTPCLSIHNANILFHHIIWYAEYLSKEDLLIGIAIQILLQRLLQRCLCTVELCCDTLSLLKVSTDAINVTGELKRNRLEGCIE